MENLILTKAKEEMSSKVPRLGNISIKELMDKFSADEAVRIAYVPIILTKTAFEYITTFTQLSAQMHRDYKKQCRTIKQAVSDYNYDVLKTVRMDLMKELEEKIDLFFDEADENIDNLWWVIKGMILKQYPDFTDKENILFCNMYMCLAFMLYIQRFELSADAMIRARTNHPYCSIRNPQMQEIIRACASIGKKDCDLNMNKMFSRAIRIIALKVDKVIKLTDAEKEGY